MPATELNEFVLRKINLPKKMWGVSERNLRDAVRRSHEDFMREWLSLWSISGSKRPDLFLFGDDAHTLFAATMQAVARRGIDIYTFHPGEIDIALDRNPGLKAEWYEMPLIGIYTFFESTSYDYKTRHFLYNLIKHRWFNQKPTVLSTSLSIQQIPEYMQEGEIIGGFLKEAEKIQT